MAKWLAVVSFIVLLTISGLKLQQRSERLRYVPTGLGVDKILYGNEDSIGLGPGASEAEFVMYELPTNVAEKIETNGIGFLGPMPEIADSNNVAHASYEDWQKTPILSDTKWADKGCNDQPISASPATPKIVNFLCNYFDSSIDKSIEKEVDGVVSKPGSFYAYGRCGILIVSPEIRRVFYVHNG